MTRPTPDPNPIVCFCFEVHEQDILHVIQRPDVHTIMDITAHCKAGNGCTSCWAELQRLLDLKSL